MEKLRQFYTIFFRSWFLRQHLVGSKAPTGKIQLTFWAYCFLFDSAVPILIMYKLRTCCSRFCNFISCSSEASSSAVDRDIGMQTLELDKDIFRLLERPNCVHSEYWFRQTLEKCAYIFSILRYTLQILISEASLVMWIYGFYGTNKKGLVNVPRVNGTVPVTSYFAFNF